MKKGKQPRIGMGQIFQIGNYCYTLCQVESGRMTLIRQIVGNRLFDPYPVRNVNDLTKKEIHRIFGTTEHPKPITPKKNLQKVVNAIRIILRNVRDNGECFIDKDDERYDPKNPEKMYPDWEALQKALDKFDRRK